MAGKYGTADPPIREFRESRDRASVNAPGLSVGLMRQTETHDEKRSVSVAIGRAEIGLGFLLFIYGTLSPMVGRLYPGLEPNVLYGFWPLFLIFGGVALVASGAGLFRNWRWPYLLHIPLVAWLLIGWQVFL
jgi:hypothetical protein